MIIFNFYAIAVAVICFVALIPVVGLMSFIPGLSENETLQGVIFYGVVTLVAGVCEVVGIKGRLFFLPVWLLAGVLTFATACQQYGWIGFGVMTVIGIALAGSLVCLAHVIEGKEWEAAPGELAQCQRIQDPSRKEFWEHFQKALFVPTVKTYTKHIHFHNHQCLELLKNLRVEWPVIVPLMDAFAANTHDDSNINVEEEQADEIKQLIAQKLEAFE